MEITVTVIEYDIRDSNYRTIKYRILKNPRVASHLWQIIVFSVFTS